MRHQLNALIKTDLLVTLLLPGYLSLLNKRPHPSLPLVVVLSHFVQIVTHSNRTVGVLFSQQQFWLGWLFIKIVWLSLKYTCSKVNSYWTTKISTFVSCGNFLGIYLMSVFYVSCPHVMFRLDECLINTRVTSDMSNDIGWLHL